MNIICDETKEAIKSEISLLDYLEQYFSFEKKSGKHFTHCPFHDEKTPSFMVDDINNTYHCFGCGAHGDIIKFVMEYDGLSFSAAVNKLSKYADIDVKEMIKSNTYEVFKSYKHNRSSHSNHVILDENIYKQYPQSRILSWEEEGIKPEIISNYDIRIDNRAKRIIYPVRDMYGHLINIKGRTMIEDFKERRIPKYINYYKVGVMDYFQGLDKKINQIKEHKEVIIFEGIKSCMKLDGWVNSPCISSEKADLTPEQIEQLLKLRCDIVIAYDKDKTLDSVAYCLKWLSRFTNLYIILDTDNLLGDYSEKQSPVDKGFDIWKELYKNRKKVRL